MFCLTIQNVEGSTLYDALDLTFANVDKTSISQVNNVDILQYITKNSLQ